MSRNHLSNHTARILKTLTKNEWSEAARKKSIEARKRKAKGAALGGSIGLGVGALQRAVFKKVILGSPTKAKLAALIGTTALGLIPGHGSKAIAKKLDYDENVAGAAGVGGWAAGIAGPKNLARGLVEGSKRSAKFTKESINRIPEVAKMLKDVAKEELPDAARRAANTLRKKAGRPVKGQLLPKQLMIGNVLQVINGGPGSGNHGHKGIPGHRGGSLAQGESAPSGKQYVRELRALIPAAPVSETPVARAKRIKNVYTKASRLADVYEAYTGELETKRRRKLLPLSKPQLEELVKAHAKAADNFYVSADQATLVKGRTQEEQVSRLKKADQHAQQAMKYVKRLGYNPLTGRALPKSAAGEFTRSVGKAFVAGLSSGVKEAAFKAGRETTSVGLDVAKEAIIGGITGGQKAAKDPAERRAEAIQKIRSELARSQKYHGAVKASIKGKAVKAKSSLPSRDANIRDIIKGIAAGASKSGKARAAAYKDYYTKRSDLDTDLETTRQTIQRILDARAQLEARATRAGVSLTGRPKKASKSGSKSDPLKVVNPPRTIGPGGKPVEIDDRDITEELKAKVAAAKEKVDNSNVTVNFSPVTANLAGKVRREELHGRDYLVAPLSMIVPGVLPGSKGPLLYPEEEVSKNPGAWNNVPIVVNHPMKNGMPVEARSPDILEKYQIGTVFNAKYDGRLVAEGWFDLERTRKTNIGIYEMLLNGRPIELSTGLYTDNEPFEGVWNGRAYKFIARNYRPDHLAILLSSKGACSIQDGCGVLINKCGSPNKKKKKLTANIISKVKGGYQLKSHKGKNLGTAKTKADIIKRERQVEYFKHVKNEEVRSEVSALIANIGYARLAKPWKAVASHLGSAARIAGAEAKPALKSAVKNPSKTAKSIGAKITEFTRKKPKTALAITGYAGYKYGRRKERNKRPVANLSMHTKKRLRQVLGFAGGVAGGALGTMAGTAAGAPGGPIGMIAGGAAGGAAGAFGASRLAKKIGGQSAGEAADIGGLVGSIVSPGGVARGVARMAGRKVATGAATGAAKVVATGSKASRIAKGAGRIGVDIGAYTGTTAGLEQTFKPKKPKVPGMRKPTMNAWTDEARRKSAETRKRNAAARGGMSNTQRARASGLATGIVIARVAGGKIERATKLEHIATGAKAVKRVVKKSFEPTIKYMHDPIAGRNILIRKPPGVGRKALRLLRKVSPRVQSILRMIRK